MMHFRKNPGATIDDSTYDRMCEVRNEEAENWEIQQKKGAQFMSHTRILPSIVVSSSLWLLLFVCAWPGNSGELLLDQGEEYGQGMQERRRRKYKKNIKSDFVTITMECFLFRHFSLSCKSFFFEVQVNFKRYISGPSWTSQCTATNVQSQSYGSLLSLQ